MQPQMHMPMSSSSQVAQQPQRLTILNNSFINRLIETSIEDEMVEDSEIPGSPVPYVGEIIM